LKHRASITPTHTRQNIGGCYFLFF
jgi:hypothetical protein